MNQNQNQNIGRIEGKLAAEPKVRIIIRSQNETEKYWEGGINGHFFRIKKDIPVEVPQSLARLIRAGAAVETFSLEGMKAYRGGGRRLSR